MPAEVAQITPKFSQIVNDINSLSEGKSGALSALSVWTSQLTIVGVCLG